MISKELFVKVIKNIQKQEKSNEEFSKAVEKFYPDSTIIVSDSLCVNNPHLRGGGL